MRLCLSVLAVSAVLSLGCGGGTSDPSPPPPPPSSNAVAVTSNQFNPQTLTVATGATVTWNFQGGLHNVTFQDNQNNSADRTTGSHTRSFGTAGTFRYRCTLHSNAGDFTTGMVGSVVVQ